MSLPLRETLKFKVTLSAIYWNKRPDFDITINGRIKAQGEFTAHSGGFESYEFEHTVQENESYKLKIRLNNKEESDCIISNDTKEILKDMALIISSIEVDDYPLGDLISSQSRFVPDDFYTFSIIPECTTLGVNGTYILMFSSPFYLWLLEKTK